MTAEGHDPTPDGLSRRHALAGAASLGVGACLLSACGGDASSSSDAGSSDGTGNGGGGDGSASSGGGPLTTTEDIEVGGGTVFGEQRVVVTQPTKGDFKGFSAVCTHQGCLVSTVSDGTINCACHGSSFSIDDGSVESGPATSPLAEVDLDIKGDKINLA